jgi:hypothetical protein
VALALGLAACQSGPEEAPAIGEAFVGSSILKIRSDIPLQSRVVATVKYGDRLEILQQRRRFLRVRTPSGAEGWTDERQLLAAEDMQKLRDLAKRAQRMPVQGQATTFGDLNVHTQPARQSPSFLQIRENEKVDVLLHTATPRTDLPRKSLIPPQPRKKNATQETKPAQAPKYPPLVIPKPPGPPKNWLELSKTDLSAAGLADESEGASEKAEPEAKEVPVDDWSLIRTKAGESGWVLTRRLVMAIPDDVAQYAEGRRIVSYFPLGAVQDGDQKKQNWLWTTISDGHYPYDYDSFRVFIWSLRRHRYETAYIERNLRGYAPVLLQQVQLGTSKAGAAPEQFPGFSVCVAKKDGQRYRREYAFVTNVVRFAGEEPCEAAAAPTHAEAQAPLKVASGANPQAKENLTLRARRKLRSLVHRVFGR